MEQVRAAVVEAIEGLDYEVIQAEQFGAQPTTPQSACLQAVRSSDGFILIIGTRYGATQASGKSATHEEYLAAKEAGKPIFVFVEANVQPEPAQYAFLSDVQNWVGGEFTETFENPVQLRNRVTRSLHRWVVSQASAVPDSDTAVKRACAALPKVQPGLSTGKARLAVSIAPTPTHSLIRPAELERPEMRQFIEQAVLFGSSRLFDLEKGMKSSVQGHTLTVGQSDGSQEVRLTEQGEITVIMRLVEPKGTMPVVIEEDVKETLLAVFKLCAALLDHVDATSRCTHVAICAQLFEAGYRGWRSRAEQAAQPNSMTVSMPNDDMGPAILSPPLRPRSSLRNEGHALAEDLTTLLRRARNGR